MSKQDDSQKHDAPRTEVGSGPTPAFPVSREAKVPPVIIDKDGVEHGGDWPRVTSQQVQGNTSDGSNVFIGSTSRQAGPHAAPSVTGSSIAVQRGDVRYSVDLNPDGSVSGTGSAAGLRMSAADVAKLAQYFDKITDEQFVSGATLDTALNEFRRASGIERK